MIIECCYLTDEEKVAAARIVERAGADFIKTSTGFGPSGAKIEDVLIPVPPQNLISQWDIDGVNTYSSKPIPNSLIT